ncbi:MULTISPECIES: hypothetical protein [Nostocales]|jgi:hypothetical protein|uniref:Type I restriction enzyme R protein N-terminal domain-containing protein n=3 Tax=Aphanizomenonaceae TaxID=1892259 RepID=A0A1Z4UY06_9CYAN|nr:MULTISPECIES: hypothetical protein [Nostocales]MBO1069400.1 hypothetical protein [Dolichospermum sp. DEX189]MCX5982509.1 hypothetical protein [Nostocales cyanobacterium LacPavin_0920_SED1_MAG_38_18]ALB42550.1 hypothetical protein AA650_20700 [Anabaena sp. WA102]MBD2281268.1 hypothetical protein [Aphanizomenon flos-aquae FACHB-1040]MBO1064480.1 hypothetical protein [Anabaena sp. 54]
MSYSDFTLETVKKNLHLNISSRDNIFSEVAPLPVSEYLQETLAYNVPVALASNTEKSRSEMIITPILLELTKKFANQISLFSGVEFNIEPSQGLNGNCDFLISRSPEFLLINTPVIIIVEAKKENIKGGLGQCIAEMYAARLFNEREENQITEIYGVVTTGEIWKFLRLSGELVQIDLAEYFLNDVNKILGILSSGVK